MLGWIFLAETEQLVGLAGLCPSLGLANDGLCFLLIPCSVVWLVVTVDMGFQISRVEDCSTALLAAGEAVQTLATNSRGQQVQ